MDRQDSKNQYVARANEELRTSKLGVWWAGSSWATILAGLIKG